MQLFSAVLEASPRGAGVGWEGDGRSLVAVGGGGWYRCPQHMKTPCFQPYLVVTMARMRSRLVAEFKK